MSFARSQIAGIVVFILGPLLYSFLLWALVARGMVLWRLHMLKPYRWRRISRDKNPFLFWFNLSIDLLAIVVGLFFLNLTYHGLSD